MMEIMIMVVVMVVIVVAELEVEEEVVHARLFSRVNYKNKC
jgi:hypothetical protein